MVTLINWFSNIKSFWCGVWNLRKEKLYPEDFSMNTASNSSVERRMVNGRNAIYGEVFMSTYLLIILLLSKVLITLNIENIT